MEEYLIANLQCITVSMKYKKAFMMLSAGILVVTIFWTDSNAKAITALKIFGFTQMVHGGSWNNIATKKHWPLSRRTYHLSEVFSVGCVSSVNESTPIMIINRNETQRERNECEVFINNYFHFFIKVDHSICAPLPYIILYSFRKHMTNAHQSK